MLAIIGRLLSLGLAWAILWGLAGAMMGIITTFLPPDHLLVTVLDPWLALATPGLIGGLIFGSLLSLMEKARPIAELPRGRLILWGLAAGALLGALPFTLGTPNPERSVTSIAVLVFSFSLPLSAMSAVISVRLSRLAALPFARRH